MPPGEMKGGAMSLAPPHQTFALCPLPFAFCPDSVLCRPTGYYLAHDDGTALRGNHWLG